MENKKRTLRETDIYELFALEICRDIFPEKELHKSERPDIMSKDNSIGIEVTRAIDKEEMKFVSDIVGNDVVKIDDKCLTKEQLRTMLFSHNSDDTDYDYIKETITESIKKKIGKARNYQAVKEMGLFIFVDNLPNEKREEFLKELFLEQPSLCKEINVDLQFDFEFIIFFIGDLKSVVLVSKNECKKFFLSKEKLKNIKQNVLLKIKNEYNGNCNLI